MKQIDIEKIKQVILKKDNLLILLLTGVLLLVIAWPVDTGNTEEKKSADLWGKTKNNNSYSKEVTDESTETAVKTETGGDTQEYIVRQLEQRLEELLSDMQGVGRVKVMVTLSSSGEKIVEKDIPLDRSNVVENDSAGGSRSTNEMYSKEETVYTTTSQGDKIPYVIQETSAKVEGVSVVAEGGDQVQVQEDISEMIQALFGIEAHKIKVVKMKQKE